MIQVLLTAPRSGGGKTAVTCALLRALRRRGLTPAAFKCGPDYLDPTFHRAASGEAGHNLDLFLSDAAGVRALYASACAGHGAAIAEGAMGYRDGVGGGERASARHVAEVLDLPVLLVLRADDAAGEWAACADGRVVGVLLDECESARRAALAAAVERESGLPVLGSLPPLAAARFGSRHLGLRAAEELADIDARLDALADALEQDFDWARFASLCDRPAPPCRETPTTAQKCVRVAVADDAAFRFCYTETREALARCGAALVPFSPLRGAALPDGVCALYLPGGYPELYARELSENAAMRHAVKTAVLGGMPTVAECGGFLYLGASLCDGAGAAYPMAGVLSGAAADAGKLVRFGYETLCAERDSLLFRAGERVNAHEFHHWESSDCGDALAVEKGARRWRCGFVSDTLYAAFPHLYFAGCPALAERFVAAARRYGEKYGLG